MAAQLAASDVDVQLDGNGLKITSAAGAPELCERSVNHIRFRLAHDISGIYFTSITKKMEPCPQGCCYLVVKLPRHIAKANKKDIVNKLVPRVIAETAAAGHLRAAA